MPTHSSGWGFKATPFAKAPFAPFPKESLRATAFSHSHTARNLRGSQPTVLRPTKLYYQRVIFPHFSSPLKAPKMFFADLLKQSQGQFKKVFFFCFSLPSQLFSFSSNKCPSSAEAQSAYVYKYSRNNICSYTKTNWEQRGKTQRKRWGFFHI